MNIGKTILVLKVFFVILQNFFKFENGQGTKRQLQPEEVHRSIRLQRI